MKLILLAERFEILVILKRHIFLYYVTPIIFKSSNWTKKSRGTKSGDDNGHPWLKFFFNEKKRQERKSFTAVLTKSEYTKQIDLIIGVNFSTIMLAFSRN